MASKTLFLLCLLIIAVAADEAGPYRKPACGDMSAMHACPMNFAPVCGTDGNTYANECALCFQRQTTKTDIMVMKDDSC